MEGNVKRVIYHTVEQTEVNQLHPKAIPAALLWVNYYILLARLGGLGNGLVTRALIECAPIFLTVAIHIFLVNFILAIKKFDKKVVFAPHFLNVVSELVPIFPGLLFAFFGS